MFKIRLVWWHYSSKGWYPMWTVHRQKAKKVKDGLLFVLRHPAVIKDGGKSDKLKPGQKSALGRPHSSERLASTWQKEKTSFTLIFNSFLQKCFFSNKIENKKQVQRNLYWCNCAKKGGPAYFLISSYKWKVQTRPMNILAAKNNDRTKK